MHEAIDRRHRRHGIFGDLVPLREDQIGTHQQARTSSVSLRALPVITTLQIIHSQPGGVRGRVIVD
jgi:hypothetical protein